MELCIQYVHATCTIDLLNGLHSDFNKCEQLNILHILKKKSTHNFLSMLLDGKKAAFFLSEKHIRMAQKLFFFSCVHLKWHRGWKSSSLVYQSQIRFAITTKSRYELILIWYLDRRLLVCKDLNFSWIPNYFFYRKWNTSICCSLKFLLIFITQCPRNKVITTVFAWMLFPLQLKQKMDLE